MIVIFLQVWTQSPRDLTPPPRAMFLTTATDITFMVPMVTTTERGPLMLRLMLRLSPRLSMATTVTLTVSLDPVKAFQSPKNRTSFVQLWTPRSGIQPGLCRIRLRWIPLRSLRWNRRHQRCPGTRRGLHRRGSHPLLQRRGLHQLPGSRRPLLDRQPTVATSLSFVKFIKFLIKRKFNTFSFLSEQIYKEKYRNIIVFCSEKFPAGQNCF